MTQTYTNSKSKLKEAENYLAGGVASSLRAAMKPTPIYAQSAKGARVVDVDGNEYIDYLLAYGPLILGHAHPKLTSSVHEAMKRGSTYGLQHEGEIKLAKKLVEILPCADKVALSGSGTEAVMLAIRLARAYTRKTKVVRFHGHYHGWSDSIFTSFPSSDMKEDTNSLIAGDVIPGTGGQSDLSLHDIILLPWNDAEVVERTLRERSSEIAAVITEPVMCNSGCIVPKPGFLQKLRDVTSEHNITLIFDEVITGFRLGPGGAHGKFDVIPDLMTMGKAMAGGVALSAVAGKEDIMNLLATGKVSHLGTLNGNGVSTAAALTTIDILCRDDGALFIQMENNALRLVNGLREVMKKHGISGVINQIGPVFHMMFTERKEVTTFDEFLERDAGKYATFAENMLNQGVIVRSSGLWYISAAHGEEEIDKTIAAADRVLATME